MSLANTLLSALRGISANKLRAALTTLGIVIGVASVIVMLALGNGARAAVDANFRFLGSDEIQIFERKVFEDGEMKSAGKPLSYSDGLDMPAEVDGVDRVDMSVNGSARVRHSRSVVNVNFQGVTADALRSVVASGQLQPVGLEPGESPTAEKFIGYGRFFTPAEALESAGVCVLAYDTALDLFEGDDPLDQTIWINRRPCTVIGVLAELESTDPDQRYRSDINEGIFMPISTAITNFFEEEPSVEITAYVEDESRIDETKAAIADYLRTKHAIEKNEAGSYEDDFELTTRNDILGAQQEAARTFSVLLAAMAVVSLAVGGIGIMNVMLVSVTERTREIGIRMAVGAQPLDIVSQFLLEAVLISAGGGLIGIVAGILAIPLAANLNQGIALLAPDSIPLSFAVALLTGVVFGLYPAARAARLRPMEALRYE